MFVCSLAMFYVPRNNQGAKNNNKKTVQYSMECIIFVAVEVWYLIPGRWSMMELAGEDKTSCSITEPSLPHFPIPTLGTSQAWVNRVQITCHTQVNQSPPPAAAVEIILFICIYLFILG